MFRSQTRRDFGARSESESNFITLELIPEPGSINFILALSL